MSQKTHGHTRIARESRIATTVRFLLAQRATKSDTSGLCLLPGLMRVGSKDGPGSFPAVAKTNDEEQGLAEQARARAVHDRERLLSPDSGDRARDPMSHSLGDSFGPSGSQTSPLLAGVSRSGQVTVWRSLLRC